MSSTIELQYINQNNIEHIDVIIDGMTCSSCSSSIESKIRNLEGISHISVNLLTKKASVQFDNTIIKPRDILLHINNLGFNSYLQKDDTKELKVLQKLYIEKKELEKPLFISCLVSILTILAFFLKHFNLLFIQEIYPGITPMTVYMLILSTFAQFTLGLKFYVIIWKQIKNNANFNMETLVIISTTLSYFLSIVMTFLNILHSKILYQTFFETSIFIFFFVSLGKYFELYGKISVAKIMNQMISNDIQNVNLVSDLNNPTNIQKISEDAISINDIIQIKPNQKIPCDGIVVLNDSYVNESMITGESKSVFKQINSLVYSGTINISDVIYIKALQTGQNTLINKIISLIENAQSKKTSFQFTTDFICKWFVYVVLSLAFLDFLILLCLGYFSLITIPLEFTYFTFALYSSVSILVVACPCAIGLATPMAIMVSTGMAMKRGILIKNGADTLEKMYKLKVIVFDKTGTLTYGNMTIVDSFVEHKDYLSYTRTLSSISNHPISKCLDDYTKHITPLAFSDSKIHSGKGVECNINGIVHKLGSFIWLKHSIYDTSLLYKLNNWMSNGFSIVLQCKDDKLVCAFAFNDVIRNEANEVIQNLQKQKLDIWMVSGDNQFNCLKVATQLNINTTQVLSNVLPESKNDIINAIQSTNISNHSNFLCFKTQYQKLSKHIVAMVGDGGNDSIALAQSDVGISLQNGNDLALSSSSVVLMKSNLKDILFLKKLSNKTIQTIYINLFWSFSYNIFSILLASGLFYPYTINPINASILMSASSLFVVLNSIFLKYRM